MAISRIQRLALAVGALSLVVFLYRGLHFSGPATTTSTPSPQPQDAKATFVSGGPLSGNHTYTKTLVMARMSWENIDWIYNDLHGFNYSIYLMDDDSHSLDPLAQHVPANKGHEAMAYLSYIIDHYNDLPDVSLFFHPHKSTWHNNILLDLDSAITISRLSPAHVHRVGYFPARCHHDPGCPDWHHLTRPAADYDMIKKKEEQYLNVDTWQQLHPSDPVPYALSGPCCAQFAVSRPRIHARPLSEYEHYRNWLLTSNLTDEFSGRVFEYNWQYIFTGEPEYCPPQHQCYCDGYGICFGGTGETMLQEWLDLLKERETVEGQIVEYRKGVSEGVDAEVQKSEDRLTFINAELIRLKVEAYKRGESAEERAKENERAWKEGDGF